MSATPNAKAAATLPDADSAYNNLYDALYAPTLLRKLASYGYEARTPQEAQFLLATAHELRGAREQPAVKQAEEAANPYGQALSGLRQLLDQAGGDGAYRAEEAAAIKQAAARLAQDATLYNSALALKADEAARTQAWLDAQGRRAG